MGREIDYHQLVEKALANLERFSPKADPGFLHTRAFLVEQLFGVYPTYARTILNRFGYDPDERV